MVYRCMLIIEKWTAGGKGRRGHQRPESESGTRVQNKHGSEVAVFSIKDLVQPTP
jgi:hypothetical protein